MMESAGLYRPGVILWLLVLCILHSTHTAPVYDDETTQLAEYGGVGTGCYYNFQYYEEGGRILTNEPCLNCTCHNRMLMCYLRVCPFTKAIGQDCKVEKRPDQCCPVITCPEVPVQLLTSTTTSPSESTDSTQVGFPDNYGCSVNNKFYADGAQLPIDSNNPCELCYCIRNRTTCVMQECTLKVAGCKPVYHPGICCPVKYNCDYEEPIGTTMEPTSGLIMTTTMAPGLFGAPQCFHKGKYYDDGQLIYSAQPCQHCYCFHGDIACAVQDCGTPMKTHGKNCTAAPPPEGACCPTTYECDSESEPSGDQEQHPLTVGDENEIFATQATIPIFEEEGKKEDDQQTLEQKPDEIFPGADNVIPQDHQVLVNETSAATEASITTETIKTETVPPNTILETNEVADKDIHSQSVTQESVITASSSIMPTITEEQATTEIMLEKSTELLPESSTAKDVTEKETSTTVVEEEVTMSTEHGISTTEAILGTSEKPLTGLPARSEDQIPIEEQEMMKPGQASTLTSMTAEEELHTELTPTEAITTEKEVSETGLPVEISTPEVKLDEQVATTENIKTELPEEQGQKATTVPSSEETSELSSISPETTSATEKTEEETIVQMTETAIEGDKTKASSEPSSDMTSVTEGAIQVTEGIKEGAQTIDMDAHIDNLMTEKPETIIPSTDQPSSLSTGESSSVTEPEEVQKAEEPEISTTETSEKITESTPSDISKNENVTDQQITEVEEKTESMPSESSAEMPEVELPTKGLEVSGEQSSEEVTSPISSAEDKTTSQENVSTESEESSSVEEMMGSITTEKSIMEDISTMTSEVANEQPTSVTEPAQTDKPIEIVTSSDQMLSEHVTESQTTEIPLSTAGELQSETTPISKTTEEVQEEHATTNLPETSETSEEVPSSETPMEAIDQQKPDEIDLTQTTQMPGAEESTTKHEVLKESTTEQEIPKESTTEQEILKESTTEQEILKESTTEQEILKESTPEQEILEESTTEQEIPKESTTEQEILKESTTEQEILKESTTEQEILKESTTEQEILKESTTEQEIPEESTTEQEILKESTTEQEIPKESTTEQEILKESTTEQEILKESTAEQEIVKESTTEQEILKETTTEQEIPKESTTEQEILKESTPEQEIVKESTTEQEILKETTTEQEIPKESTTEKEILKESTTEAKIEESPEQTTEAIETSSPEQPMEPITESKLDQTEELPTEESITTDKTTESEIPEKIDIQTTEEDQFIETPTPIIPHEDEEEKRKVTTVSSEKVTESTIVMEDEERKETTVLLSTTESSEITEEQTTEKIPHETESEQGLEVSASTQPTISHETVEISEPQSTEEISEIPLSQTEESNKIPETELESSTSVSMTDTDIDERPMEPVEETMITEHIPQQESDSDQITEKLSTEFTPINETTTKEAEKPEISDTELPTKSTTAEPTTIETSSESDQQIPEITEQSTEIIKKEAEEETTLSKDLTTTEESIQTSPATKDITTEAALPPIKTHELTTIKSETESSPEPTTEKAESFETPASQEVPQETETPIEMMQSTEKQMEQTIPEIHAPAEIPGEGSCLVDGQTFANNNMIPPANPCQLSCRCINSIVQCELVQCSPPPSLTDCMPIHTGKETCCPMYSCTPIPTESLESDNQMVEKHTPSYGQDQEQESMTGVPITTKTPEEHTQAPIETKSPETEEPVVVTTESSSFLAPTVTEPESIVIDASNLTKKEPDTSSIPSESTITTPAEDEIKDSQQTTIPLAPAFKESSTAVTEGELILPTSAPTLSTDRVEASETTTQAAEPTEVPTTESDEKRMTEPEIITEKTPEISTEEQPSEQPVEPTSLVTEMETATEKIEATEMVSEGTTVTAKEHTTVESVELTTKLPEAPVTEGAESPAPTLADTSTVPVQSETEISLSPETQTAIPVEQETPKKEMPSSEPASSTEEKNTSTEMPLTTVEMVPVTQEKQTESHIDATTPESKISAEEMSTTIKIEQKIQEEMTTVDKDEFTTIKSEISSEVPLEEASTQGSISPIGEEEQTEISIAPTSIPEEPIESTSVINEITTVDKSTELPISESPATASEQEITHESTTITSSTEGILEGITSSSTEEETSLKEEMKTSTPSIIEPEPISEIAVTEEHKPIDEMPMQTTILSDSQTEKSTVAELPQETLGTTQPSIEIQEQEATTSESLSPEKTTMHPIELTTSTTLISETQAEMNVSMTVGAGESDIPLTTEAIVEESTDKLHTIDVEKHEGAQITPEEHTSETEPSIKKDEEKEHEEEDQKHVTASISSDQTLSDVTGNYSIETTTPTITTSTAVHSDEISTEISSEMKPEEAFTDTPIVKDTTVAEKMPEVELTETPELMKENIPESSTGLPTESTEFEKPITPAITVKEKEEGEEKEKEESTESIDKLSSISPSTVSETSTIVEEYNYTTPATTASAEEGEKSTAISTDQTTEDASVYISSTTEIIEPIKTEITTEKLYDEISTQASTELPHISDVTEITSSEPATIIDEATPMVSHPTPVETEGKKPEAEEHIPEVHEDIKPDKATTDHTTPSISSSSPEETEEDVQQHQIPELPLKPQQEDDQQQHQIPELPFTPQEEETTPQHQVPELPSKPQDEHEDGIIQQPISPDEHEITQEHIPEQEYPSSSTTLAPQSPEYPEQQVTGADNPHFPINAGSYLTPDEEYDEDDQAVYGPGTCRYGGKIYVSAQQIPRDDPCDFCFCFRSDIICLQQSCPPPIPGCHEEPISGFCCPRYECPVSMGTSLNVTTTTTTTTTTLPPHFLSHAYKGAARRTGCQINGQAYKVGEEIKSKSGPCYNCTCGGDGNMKCDPRVCTPEPMIRHMIASATAKRRRR